MKLVVDKRRKLPEGAATTRREYIENIRRLTLAERRREESAKFVALAMIIAGAITAMVLWTIIHFGWAQ